MMNASQNGQQSNQNINIKKVKFPFSVNFTPCALKKAIAKPDYKISKQATQCDVC